MAIQAKISGVEEAKDGSVYFHLLPSGDAPAGQPRLEVVNPVSRLSRYVGATIWGNATSIYRSDRRFATRLTATKIRLEAP